MICCRLRNYSPQMIVTALAVTALLTSCSSGSGTTNGGGGGTPPPTTYTIGGIVSGLAAGDNLSLEDNGGDMLTVTANGTFTFATKLTSGSAYSVTVSTQPASPAQGCTVSNGSGTATANVTSVAVACTASGEVVLYSFKGGTSDGGYYTTAGTLMSHAELLTDSSGNLYGTTQFGGQDNLGTVFKLAKGSGGSYTENVLYSFQGGASDGSWPVTGLIADSNGNLYGTTLTGGTGSCTISGQPAGCGTVFKLTKTSGGSYTENLLHSFQGGTSDGATPYAALTMDSSGNLYGTTGDGGAGSCTNPVQPAGCGTVFKLALNSNGSYTESVLYSFQGGTTDGNEPQAGLIMDSGGNLYGTTATGGSRSCNNFIGCGTVFKLAPGGNGSYTESLLYSFKGEPGDGAGPSDMVMDSGGNLYGTTAAGGTDGYSIGTVFKLTKGASGSYAESMLHSFQSGAVGGFGPEPGLIMDSGGSLYGAAQEGGADGYGAVFKMAPGSGGSYTESSLYSFQSGSSDGALPFAGVIMDSNGNLYGTTVMGGTNDQGMVFEIVQ